ncbi:hypothetical protein LSAT2_001229 [Lamellibrachia satsuma]|nr:hypothetical protein LSAT2_001229 [Lamellibrachia satsuma]
MGCNSSKSTETEPKSSNTPKTQEATAAPADDAPAAAEAEEPKGDDGATNEEDETPKADATEEVETPKEGELGNPNRAPCIYSSQILFTD